MEPKSTVTNVESSLERFNSKFEQAAERINDLENRSVEISQTEAQKENRIKEN